MTATCMKSSHKRRDDTEMKKAIVKETVKWGLPLLGILVFWIFYKQAQPIKVTPSLVSNVLRYLFFSIVGLLGMAICGFYELVMIFEVIIEKYIVKEEQE